MKIASIRLEDNNRTSLAKMLCPGFPSASRKLSFRSFSIANGELVIDSTGNLVNREEYTPYGETSFGSFARKRYRFTGKERDEESGLNYHGARYYVPWLARWTSSDPAGTVDGPNLYSYVANNPIRLIDLSGLQGSAGDVPPTPDISNTPSATDTGGGPPHRDPSSYNGSETEHTFHGRDADTISLDVHDLPYPEPQSDDASYNLEHEPAGTYSNSPPGGVGEPEWTNSAASEGTAPLVEGIIIGAQHAIIDQVEGAVDQAVAAGAPPGLPGAASESAVNVLKQGLENEKSVVPNVQNGSGGLGWAIGFALTNALTIFGMVLIGGRLSKGPVRDTNTGWDPNRGKVHGTLPKAGELRRYSPDELRQLKGELELSVQERIRKNVERGPDIPHGQRQADEQLLIRQIVKHLEGR